MLSVTDYGALIADPVRMGAFTTGLKRTVTPDSVVIDLGTGTGICALIACALGARKVYAIESDDVIEVARSIAATNGYADRIEFHHAVSGDVVLPERGDVIVADMAGMLPWFHRGILSIIDARRRMLKPQGVVLPQRDVVWTAVVEAEEMYFRHTGAWRGNQFAFDMEAARGLAVNAWSRGRCTSDQLLASPRRWCVLDYKTIDDATARGTMECVISRRGVGHGLAAGFDRVVIDGVEISNAPDRPDAVKPTLICEPVFFPWLEPVPLDAGDTVNVEISGVLVRQDYVWSWKTHVRSASGDTKAPFNQSTFLSTPLSAASLKKRTPGYVPSLTNEGRVMLMVLAAMAERQPCGEIARRVVELMPTRFTKPADALAFVSDLVAQYG